MAKTPTSDPNAPLTAEEQTRINAAPTNESTAGDPREVETVDAPLVFNDGTPVVTPTADDDSTTYRLTHPGGTTVEVTGAARRDSLLARGYTESGSGTSSTSSSTSTS